MTPEEKASQKRLVLLVGDENALRRKALEDILKFVGILPDDFDLQTFDAQSSQPSEWHAAAGTSPFLAERRTVIVRHALQSDLDKLSAVNFANLPESSLLILVADDEAGSDERDKGQRLKTVAKGLEKLVQKADGAILKFDPDPKKTREAIKKEASSLGKEISDRTADTLAEMSGGSLSRSLEELLKVALYGGDSPAISERDVREVAAPSREWNVFKMVDAIVNNHVAEALRQLKVLMATSKRADEAAYGSILPILSRNLRLIWQARLCADAGCSAASPTPEVVRMFPSKPNLLTEQPYRQGQIMAVAKKTKLSSVGKALGVLSDADARLKGGLPSFSSMETLERMILDMATALSSTS